MMISRFHFPPRFYPPSKVPHLGFVLVVIFLRLSLSLSLREFLINYLLGLVRFCRPPQASVRRAPPRGRRHEEGDGGGQAQEGPAAPGERQRCKTRLVVAYGVNFCGCAELSHLYNVLASIPSEDRV